MKTKQIEVPVTDGSAWLDRLTPRQMISIGDRLWSDQRKRLIADLKDAEIGSSERVIALRELDGRRGMMSEIVHHAINISGSIEIIAEAAKGKNADNAEGLPDDFAGTSEEAIKIALDLIGAQLGKSSSDKTKKK